MDKDLMVLTGYSVDSIKDATIRRATKGMADAVARGVKSGWEFAYNAMLVKESFNVPKGQELPASIKNQFGTLKAYSEAVGVSTASIHNSAKAFDFMTEQGLVPKKILKNGKDAVDFDRFTLSVGQAVELAAYNKDQLEALKATCEKEGISINCLSTATIRRFKNTGSLIAEGTHKAIESGKEETKEVPEEDTKEDIKEDSKKVNKPELTKDELIAGIIATMKKYDIKLTEVAAAYNASLSK